MEQRILELALESLVARKAAIEAEIVALKAEMSPKPSAAATPKAAAPVKGNKRVRSAASRKAQSEKMKAYWVKRRAAEAKQAAKQAAKAKSR